jgi:signal transduction histidine kinase
MVLHLDAQLAATWGFALGRPVDAAARPLALIGPAHRDRFVEHARQVQRDGLGARLVCDVALDGELRTYEFRIERLDDGIAAVGFDVTASRLAELTLREADRRKDEFLATLSHELRNPLTPLRAALDVAKLSGEDPAKLQHSLGIMDRQVAHLVQLVDELLDLSRITQGKIELERRAIDPASVVDEALESTAPLVAEMRHTLSVDVERGHAVLADRGRLVQVLVNLITNAAKYTREGGHIAVALARVPGRDAIVVRVRDDGAGIPPEILPHVFDLFVQSRDARGRSRGGLGIGLNLVRRLVELHGGAVSASSPGLGHGSEFAIELPLIAA